jgi:hypothetical protein
LQEEEGQEAPSYEQAPSGQGGVILFICNGRRLAGSIMATTTEQKLETNS